MAPNSWIHLIDALLGASDGLVAVISHAYFDESGTDAASPVMTLAGYLFKKSEAEKFSRLWARQLERFDLPCAHMTDCQAIQGAYRDKDAAKRLQICKALISLTRARSTIGISVGMILNDYTEEMRSKMTPYSYLLTRAVMLMRETMSSARNQSKVVYLFEAGHKDAGESNELMGRLGSHRGIEEFYRYNGHGFLPKRDGLPLQAADMLAWLHRHYIRTILNNKEKARPDYLALLRPSDRAIHISKDMLADDFANMQLAYSPDPLSIIRWDHEFISALANP